MYKKIKLIILVLSAVAIGILIYFFLVYNNYGPNNTIEPPLTVDEIEEYGYILDESKGEYYKELFIDLKVELSKENTNEELYAEIISKMFIADFYTLANKVTKNDIGGIDFIHENIRQNFIDKARDTLYKYIISNVYGEREQQLPIVETVEVITINKKPFTYLTNIRDDSAYEITLSWVYEEDLGYQTQAKLILVHDNNKLYIVEVN